MKQIRITDPNGRSFDFPFEPTEGLAISIGKSESCAVHLAEDPFASRVHCYVQCANGYIYISDNHSTNGLFRDEVRVSAEHMQEGVLYRAGASYIVLMEAEPAPVEEPEFVPPPLPEAEPAPVKEPEFVPPPLPEAEPAPEKEAEFVPPPLPEAEPAPVEEPEFVPPPLPEAEPAPVEGPEFVLPPLPEAEPAPVEEPEFVPPPLPEAEPAPVEEAEFVPFPESSEESEPALEPVLEPEPIPEPPPSEPTPPSAVRPRVFRPEVKVKRRKAAPLRPAEQGKVSLALHETRKVHMDAGVVNTDGGELPADFGLRFRLDSVLVSNDGECCLRFGAHADSDCCLYLVQHDVEGATELLLPEAPDTPNRLYADVEALFPPLSDKCDYEYELAPPYGEEVVVAVACSQPVPLPGALAEQLKRGDCPPVQGELALIETLSRRYPGARWAVACLRFDTRTIGERRD
ncbi:MAG: FHA domain-containing protein [Akkermansia muciniphila]|nr:FHA domain-containing protein [Akkermansia muciniphila]